MIFHFSLDFKLQFGSRLLFLDLSTEDYPALNAHSSLVFLVFQSGKYCGWGSFSLCRSFSGLQKTAETLAMLKAKIEFALPVMEVSLCFAVKCWDVCSVWKEDVLQVW